MIKLPEIKFPPENVMAYNTWLRMVCNPNNFSFWYERVKDCGLKIPASAYYQFTYDDVRKYIGYIYGEDKDMNAKRKEFCRKILIPLLDDFLHIKNRKSDEIFIKNAVFSNKFTFSDCHIIDFVPLKDVVKNLENINYTGLLVGAEGFNEIVLREYIHPKLNFGEIYNGMALRPEFRVFYDFDKQKLLYTVNYRNYQYCEEHLNVEDKAVFSNAEAQLNKYFKQYVDEVEKLVIEHMPRAWLEGKWSIDIMMNDENDFYLIDMALAKNSAYWDPEHEGKSNE